MGKGRKICSSLLLVISHLLSVQAASFRPMAPPLLGGFMIICGPYHCTVPQPFFQPADEPHLAVRADLCQGLGCGTPQVPPHCGLVVRLLPVGYGVSCIGSVTLGLEAIPQSGICEVAAGFLMDLHLALTKIGKCYLPSCEMKPSKRRRDNRVTREVSWKTEEFYLLLMKQMSDVLWIPLCQVGHNGNSLFVKKFMITKTFVGTYIKHAA